MRGSWTGDEVRLESLVSLSPLLASIGGTPVPWLFDLPPPHPPPSLSGMRSALLSLEWGRVLGELIRLHVVRGRPRTIAGVGRRTEACLRGGARAPTQARPPLSQPSVHLS